MPQQKLDLIPLEEEKLDLQPLDLIPLEEEAEPIPKTSVLSRFGTSLGRSTAGIVQGVGEMMMGPGDVSGLASKIAEPFTFGPEMSGEEKTLLGLELLTGIPISELRRQYAEGNYAGMAGTALPAIALTALGGYGMRRKGVPRPTPEVPTQLVQDILRAQRFLKSQFLLLGDYYLNGLRLNYQNQVTCEILLFPLRVQYQSLKFLYG